MHGTEEIPEGRGRLHGRLLQVLGAFSAVVALLALWQLGVFGGDDDREPVSAVDGPTSAWYPSEGASGGAGASVDAESSPLESPSDSASAEASSTPTDAATTAGAQETADEPEEEAASAAAAECRAYLRLNEEWGRTVDVEVEVVNTGGGEIAWWEVDLGIEGLTVTGYWNMRDLGGGRFGSEDWNGRLDPGENAVTGFQADAGRNVALPETVPCTARKLPPRSGLRHARPGLRRTEAAMSEYEHVQVVTTTDSAESAAALARGAAESRLAACAQVFGPVCGVCWWGGRVGTAPEWRVVFKTAAACPGLETRVEADRGYKVPEVVVLPIPDGSRGYLEWITEETIRVP